MDGKFKFPIKTAVLGAAAVLYTVLIADWCVPGYGLHQAAVALGGFGWDGAVFASHTPWGFLVRRIGWNVHLLGALSAFGALFCAGLIALMAERIITMAIHRAKRLGDEEDEFRLDAQFATLVVILSFVLTPGLLRTATTVGPFLFLLVFPLSGLAILVHVFVNRTEQTVRQLRARSWMIVSGVLLLIYGIWTLLQIGRRGLVSHLPSVLFFLLVGVLPFLAFAALIRKRRLISRRLQLAYLGTWFLIVFISGIVAVQSADRGQVATRFIERIIVQAGEREAIVSEGMLDDLFLFMLPSDKRLLTYVRDREPAYGRELARWVREIGVGEGVGEKLVEDLVFAAELGPRALVDEWMQIDPKGFGSTVLTPAEYFPTVEKWRAAYGEVLAALPEEPLRVFLLKYLGACGNHLGCKALEAGDGQLAWQTFWEILDHVDRENYTAVVNLYGMIQRGTAVLPETRKKLDDRLLAIRNRLKTPEQLMRAARAGGRLYIDPKVRERYERLQKEALARDEISPRAREFIAAVSVAPRDAQSAEKARMEIHKAVKDGLVRIDRIGDQLLNIDIALKDWVRAEIDALDILRFNRRHLRANAVMGAINGVRGDREAAERYLRRALEAGENDAIACNDLAFLLVSQGRAKEAIPLARLAARLRPLDWNFRETLAIALIRGGVPDEGEMELKMAEEIAAQAGVPNGKVVRFDLDRAWLYKVRGQEIPLQVTLTNLHRAVGLSKAHLKEVEVLEK